MEELGSKSDLTKRSLDDEKTKRKEMRMSLLPFAACNRHGLMRWVKSGLFFIQLKHCGGSATWLDMESEDFGSGCRAGRSVS